MKKLNTITKASMAFGKSEKKPIGVQRRKFKRIANVCAYSYTDNLMRNCGLTRFQWVQIQMKNHRKIVRAHRLNTNINYMD